ncbi:MAG: sigma-70 family RNA polymerase sigma factor [Chloroflexota bacterium]
MGAVRYKELEGEKARDNRPANAGDENTRVSGLIGRFVDGDFEAFGELYSTYLDRIYRYVYYQVRDRMLAEDLTEEIFVKAWEAIGKFKPEKLAFSAWLYRIAHNHVIDYYRTRRQHLQLDEEMPDKGRSLEQELEETLMQQELSSLLNCLSPQQRQVIILKFIEDMDNRQIAKIMRKSEGAIRVMQMRALTALREKMGSEKKICNLNYLKHLANV